MIFGLNRQEITFFLRFGMHSDFKLVFAVFAFGVAGTALLFL